MWLHYLLKLIGYCQQVQNIVQKSVSAEEVQGRGEMELATPDIPYLHGQSQKIVVPKQGWTGSQVLAI